MNKVSALSLYRQFFKSTQNCKDKYLKLYVRRRIREEYEHNKNADTAQVDKLLDWAKN